MPLVLWFFEEKDKRGRWKRLTWRMTDEDAQRYMGKHGAELGRMEPRGARELLRRRSRLRWKRAAGAGERVKRKSWLTNRSSRVVVPLPLRDRMPRIGSLSSACPVTMCLRRSVLYQ